MKLGLGIYKIWRIRYL